MTGSTTHVEPANGQHFTLDELDRLLGCDMVEIIPLGSGHLMVIEAKGTRKDNSRINGLATHARRLARGDAAVIVRPALVCRVEEALIAPPDHRPHRNESEGSCGEREASDPLPPRILTCAYCNEVLGNDRVAFLASPQVDFVHAACLDAARALAGRFRGNTTRLRLDSGEDRPSTST